MDGIGVVGKCVVPWGRIGGIMWKGNNNNII